MAVDGDNPSQRELATTALGVWDGFYAQSYRRLCAVRRNAGTALSERDAQACLDEHLLNPAGSRHWEFLATGALHLFDVSPQLSHSLKALVTNCLGRFENSSSTRNWRLMRELSTQRLAGKRLCARSLRRAGLDQRTDGFLPDAPGGESTQYHAYLLLLILRFGEHGDREVQMIVRRAFDWLRHRWELDGDPNAVGRGRFQVFGYASMAAAASLSAKWTDCSPDPIWAALVEHRAWNVEAGGVLSRCWSGPHRRSLLHGYNTPSDYVAFRDLWLATSSSMPPPNPTDLPDGIWWHATGDGSGLLSTARGIEAAVTSPPATMSSQTGRVERLRSIFRRTREATAPVRAHLQNEGCIAVAPGLYLSVTNSHASITVTDDYVASRLIVETPYIWLRRSTKAEVSMRGAVECELVMGSESGDVWLGRSFRVVAKGYANLTFAIG
jgi:hypothetical protein